MEDSNNKEFPIIPPIKKDSKKVVVKVGVLGDLDDGINNLLLNYVDPHHHQISNYVQTLGNLHSFLILFLLD